MIQYLDLNNQHWRALSQPIPYDGFEYVEDISMFTHAFIITYNKNSNFDYILVVDVDYFEYLQPLHRNPFTQRPFLPEKIEWLLKKIKLACIFHNKINYRCTLDSNKPLNID